MICRIVGTPRHGVAWVLLVCLLFAPGQASAQDADVQRARTYLDTARVLIDPERGLTSAGQYAELLELEARANRPDQARELTFLIHGLMLEDQRAKPEQYQHLLAAAFLDQGQTADALRVLEQIAAPNITTQNLYLRAVHQTTARFGLQRGVTLARQAFPRIADRRGVYCKLCYTLVLHDQADLALEFAEVTLDLTEIFLKLDAYLYIAVAMHQRGDRDNAVEVLEETYEKVRTYAVIATRASMLTDLAMAYLEIDEAERSRALMTEAAEVAQTIDPQSMQLNDAIKDVSIGWARLGDRERALAFIATSKNEFARNDVVKVLIEFDIKSGQFDRAAALNEQYAVIREHMFKSQVALALLERGELEPALSDLKAQAELAFGGEEMLRAGAASLSRQGQHVALLAWAEKFADRESRFHIALGAAEGLLPRQDMPGD